MCDHGRGLDGRTVARSRHTRQAVYKQGWADEGSGRRASRRPKSSQNRGILARKIEERKAVKEIAEKLELTADSINKHTAAHPLYSNSYEPNY